MTLVYIHIVENLSDLVSTIAALDGPIDGLLVGVLQILHNLRCFFSFFLVARYASAMYARVFGWLAAAIRVGYMASVFTVGVEFRLGLGWRACLWANAGFALAFQRVRYDAGKHRPPQLPL